MPHEHAPIPVAFHRTAAGTEPVREWLRALDAADRKIVGDDLRTLQFGWPVGMPLCRSIASHGGLWEIRSRLTGGRIVRLLFCIADGRLIVLHGFIKKTRKTPKQDLDLAVRRMNEVLR